MSSELIKRYGDTKVKIGIKEVNVRWAGKGFIKYGAFRCGRMADLRGK